MSERIGTLTSVVINTTDVAALAPFWQAVLGVETAHAIDEYFVWLQPQSRHGVRVALQKVPDPTPGRRRLHLDLLVDDLASARGRIEALGGSHVEDHTMGGISWSVMRDPDGNEFCIARA
ncbi:MAG: VOC family protein [Actinobacteria bacterium]|nr:VOC family protein [Actinomycetota bacterium]